MLTVSDLAMSNGPQDLVENYDMTAEAAEFITSMTILEIGYLNQLVAAVDKYRKNHVRRKAD